MRECRMKGGEYTLAVKQKTAKKKTAAKKKKK